MSTTIIAVDHGYGNIKTVHEIFPSGITACKDEPTFSQDTVTAFNRADKHLSAEGKNAYNVRIRNFLQFLERNGDMP